MKKEIIENENFLCGLVMPEFNCEVYLTYIGGDKVKYDMFWNDKLLFAGNDYKPAPAYNQDSLDAIIGLLGFLTLKEGDTDKEYFKNYTKEQKKWSKSRDCENISNYVSDFDDTTGEYYKDAREWFESKYLPEAIAN